MPTSMPPEPKPTVWQVLKSVLAAIFGVQSSQARERDFKHGNAWIFIIAGLVVVTLFVLGLYWLVQVVIASAR